MNQASIILKALKKNLQQEFARAAGDLMNIGYSSEPQQSNEEDSEDPQDKPVET